MLTPPDVLSQMSLALPLVALYEGSIWSVRMVEKRLAAERAARPPRDRQARGVIYGVIAGLDSHHAPGPSPGIHVSRRASASTTCITETSPANASG